MIFVFVIDTSASMNQRSHYGFTLIGIFWPLRTLFFLSPFPHYHLDSAKSCVERFLQLRRPQSMRDRYFLVPLPLPFLIKLQPSPSPPFQSAALLPIPQVTCAKGAKAVSAGWKDSYESFSNALKNLEVLLPCLSLCTCCFFLRSFDFSLKT